jgi:hypothetical protein
MWPLYVGAAAIAAYYLGGLWYDKRQRDKRGYR